MFEISIPEIKKCVRDLEEQEKELNNLIRRMETVCADFDSLAEDASDRKALLQYLEQMQGEKRDMLVLRQTLSEIVHCYEETENRIVGGKILPGKRNQFGLTDFSHVGQMLDGLDIVFK